MSLANQLLVDGFDRVRDIVQQAVDGLDEDQLSYRPDRDANSIAWLTWHLSRVQDDHIADVAGGEQIWTAGGWVERFRLPFDVDSIGFGHTSDDVASVRASAEMLSRLPGRRAPGHRRLPQDAERRRLRTGRDERWDPPVTLAVRLLSVLGDTTQHAGQASYVRGLVDRL